MRRADRVAVLLLVCAAASSCKSAPPAPTVALAEATRPGVALVRGGSTPLIGERRLERGTLVRTPVSGRATVRLDGGAWALVDAQSEIEVDEGRIALKKGRLWVDAREVEPVAVTAAGLELGATSAGFAVEVDGKGARAYCVAGQLTWMAPGKTGNRLEAGMSVRSAGGDVKEEPEAQWDDWTGGLAEPGPPRALEPAGVGQLAGRRPDETGDARTPLLIRRHDVRATITSDLAVTDVEQVFFNPRSEELEGVYTLRVPPGAILAGFAVHEEQESSLWGIDFGRLLHVVPPARPGEGVPGVALEWAGPDRYRARIPSLPAGKTRIVHVRYVEWLPHREGRRTWTYPMGGGTPPLLGEFSLEVDTSAAQAGALEAGMGARVEGSRVVLRKSDFRPHADFALDLLDGKKSTKATPVYHVTASDAPGKGYVLVALDPSLGHPPQTLDLVLVADVSAATDPTRLDLEKAVVDGILRQLHDGDRVAVMAASLGARPLGDGAPLGPATRERTEKLLDALARQPPSGATDLAAALEQAAALLPGGKGAVVYLGDGQPTVGPLLPGDLKDRLARLGHTPRVFTVAIGEGARADVLSALAQGGGLALRVDDRPDASHAAFRIVAAAAEPALRDLTFDFGSTVDVAYPAGAVTVTPGEPLRLVGRLRGAVPRKLVLTGLRDGDKFREEIELVAAHVDESGDLRRRWAAARLADLLARGAGREAVVEIGARFGLITPWTALAVDNSGSYVPLESPSDAGTYIPLSVRDRAPDDTPIALVGSSRVDLQACKLEYSIVSPK